MSRAMYVQRKLAKTHVFMVELWINLRPKMWDDGEISKRRLEDDVSNFSYTMRYTGLDKK